MSKSDNDGIIKKLDDPIPLSCSEIVCKELSEEICEINCHLNTEILPASNSSTKLEEAQLTNLNTNITQFNESNKLLEDLNKNLLEIEAIRADPASLISEHFYELNRKVDLRRETFIRDVEQHSNELIEKIAVFHNKCLAEATTSTKLTESIEEYWVKMKELNVIFEVDNDLKKEEILSQKRLKELRQMIDSLMDEYKVELLGSKSCELDMNEIAIKDIFGSLRRPSEEPKLVSVHMGEVSCFFIL